MIIRPTRRELVIGASLGASLIRPAWGARLFGRVGGGPSLACTGVPITSDSQITGPGVYCLTADVVGDFNLTTFSNVELQGNGHNISGNLELGNGDTPTGVYAHDLTVGSWEAVGSVIATQILPPILHIKNVTSATISVIRGSNVLCEYCTLAGTGGSADDDMQMWLGSPINHFNTVDHCVFGANTDLGLEGLGGWDNCVISNNLANPGSIGGFYGVNYEMGDRSFTFSLTNNLFTGNTVEPAHMGGVGFYFARVDHSNLINIRSDASGNLQFGSEGNVFTGNIYPP